MNLLIVLLAVALFVAATSAQSRYNPYREKPGSCPPALPVQICTASCYADGQCMGSGKCCPTSCGGYVCSRPVTMRRPEQTEKPGSCPSVPTGRWICSPTCSVDSDCRGNMKCCKNRCGALACQKPDVEVIESIEIPVEPLPDDPYNVLGNRYNFLRNRNMEPYYAYNNN